jgi:hypothetical protein
LLPSKFISSPSLYFFLKNAFYCFVLSEHVLIVNRKRNFGQIGWTFRTLTFVYISISTFQSVYSEFTNRDSSKTYHTKKYFFLSAILFLHNFFSFFISFKIQILRLKNKINILGNVQNCAQTALQIAKNIHTWHCI